MAAEFTIAVNSNTLDYVEVTHFQATPGIGLDCGCSCPECGEKVGARIFVASPESSCFFHAADSKRMDCSGGGRETALHFLAKKLLEQEQEIFLPHPDKEGQPIKFRYDNVRLERKMGMLRPDLVLTNSADEQLIIEITVTHKTVNNRNKMLVLKKLGIPAIEISLDQGLISRLIARYTESLTSEIFAKIYREPLVSHITRKLWLVKPNGNLDLDIIEKGNEKSAAEEDDSNGAWVFLAILVIGFLLIRACWKKKRSELGERK
jgi:hypothetical protein